MTAQQKNISPKWESVEFYHQINKERGWKSDTVHMHRGGGGRRESTSLEETHTIRKCSRSSHKPSESWEPHTSQYCNVVHFSKTNSWTILLKGYFKIVCIVTIVSKKCLSGISFSIFKLFLFTIYFIYIFIYSYYLSNFHLFIKINIIHYFYHLSRMHSWRYG